MQPVTIIPDATGLVGREKNPYLKPVHNEKYPDVLNNPKWHDFERTVKSYPLTSYQEPGKEVEAVLVWQIEDASKWYNVNRHVIRGFENNFEVYSKDRSKLGIKTRQAYEVKQVEKEGDKSVEIPYEQLKRLIAENAHNACLDEVLRIIDAATKDDNIFLNANHIRSLINQLRK